VLREVCYSDLCMGLVPVFRTPMPFEDASTEAGDVSGHV
jgi:hypothetical protein